MSFGRQIGASILILLILLGSLGIALDIHYCRGEVKNVSLFSDSNGCSMESESNLLCEPISAEEEIGRNKCCSNDGFFYRSTTESSGSVILIPHSSEQIIDSKYSDQITLTSLGLTVSEICFDPPPNLFKVERTAIQQFLI